MCLLLGFHNGSVGKESSCDIGDTGGAGSIPVSGRSTGGGKWQLISVFLPGKFHGWRGLVGYSPWGLQNSLDMTKLACMCLLSHNGRCLPWCLLLGSQNASPRIEITEWSNFFELNGEATRKQTTISSLR